MTALAELAVLEQAARTAQARIARLEKIGANLTEDLDDLAARSIAGWLCPEDRAKADLCGFSEKMAEAVKALFADLLSAAHDNALDAEGAVHAAEDEMTYRLLAAQVAA